MRDSDKNEDRSNIQYWAVNNLHGWAMSQKLPVNTFQWIKDTLIECRFNIDFIKNPNKESDEGS